MEIIRIGQEVCTDLERASRLEWLETNGLGGFAASTITGLNTRRYHGLLTAAMRPPAGRVVLLSKLEETVVVDAHRYELSVNRYPGAIHPRGHEFLREFRLDPFPTFVYRLAGFEIEKRVFQVQGESTTVVEYEIRSLDRVPLPAVRLELRPLIAFRDYHATTHRNSAINAGFETAEGGVVLRPYQGLPALHLAHDATEVETAGLWYRDFEYERERERGLDFQEDLFCPLVVHYNLSGRATAAVIASTEPHAAANAPFLREDEIRRRARLAADAPVREPLVEALTVAADQFLVRRGEFRTIIAGYPWFTDWGRDTMIALPGLALTTGRVDEARGILEAFAQYVDHGMLPNRFPEHGEAPEYNTVDAALWFCEAVRAYLAHTGDEAFGGARLFPKLKDILDWHIRGTRYGIQVDEDGLLRGGEPGVQLTWMDAKVGEWVVTPRSGKPVEIQALWYHALRVIADLARQFGDAETARLAGERAASARRSFLARFWNQGAGCLYDVVDGEFRDPAIRPNQILAVSLPNSMLEAAQARAVVDVVQRHLLTPLGLRSLAPGDAHYRGRYEGGVWERDSAYHQGTVWPWLMGPFVTAYLRVHGHDAEARRQAAAWLDEFRKHMRETCLGQVSEIADGDSPHEPRGCVAQAWSVAELLRVAVELHQLDKRMTGRAGE